MIAGAPPQKSADDPPAAADAAHLDVVAAVRVTVVHFIEQSGGEAADDFTDHTPFMDAGLDSLDVMKVCCLRAGQGLSYGSEAL